MEEGGEDHGRGYDRHNIENFSYNLSSIFLYSQTHKCTNNEGNAKQKQRQQDFLMLCETSGTISSCSFVLICSELLK